METVRMLNADILNVTADELLGKLKRGVLITPNVDHLVRLQKDEEFYKAYQEAEWVVCDSKILYFLSKFTKNPLKAAIPGSSFFGAFYRRHANNPDCRIFLLGAAEGVAAKAMEAINAKVGRQIVVGAHSPSYGFEKNAEECEEIIGIVNRSGANVLVVGVGAPKQEKWIAKYRSAMPGVDLFMGLGATIDFESGQLSRAPKWMQAIGLEWLYRILKDPKRLAKRYLVDDMAFFGLFLKQMVGKYRNPFGAKGGN